jgi:hypothetical protein
LRVTYQTFGTLTGTDTTTTNLVSTNSSIGTLNNTNIINTNLSSSNSILTNITSTNTLLTNINTTNTTITNTILTSATVTNSVVNIETIGSLLVTTSANLRFNSNTIGNIVTTGGNVGINTNINLYGFTKELAINAASGTSGYSYGVAGSLVGLSYCDASNMYIGTYPANPLIFRTNNSERIRIDPSGNLLVGTTSVFTGTYAVNVMGAAGNRAYLGMKRETASTSGVCGSLQGYNGTNSIAAIDLAANGANNSGLIQTYTWSAGSVVQGPYVNTGGTSWTTASDETLKDIIAPIEDATSKLSGLRTVFGKYKTDHADVRRIFLIAQDVQTVLPEAVSIDGNGKLGLNYQDLVPVLVKAIQEQQALITQLQADVAALKDKA